MLLQSIIYLVLNIQFYLIQESKVFFNKRLYQQNNFFRIYNIIQKSQSSMFFTSFALNAYTIMQTYENEDFFQNCPNQTTGLITTFPLQFNDFYQWNKSFLTQDDGSTQKIFSVERLKTTDDYLQSEVIIDAPKFFESHKKKGKRTAKKQISSGKKNSESNIIKQFYSFFSCKERSEKIVKKAIKASIPSTKFQQKIQLFFNNTIQAINLKRGRKYVNRTMMLNCFTPDMLKKNFPELQEKFEKTDLITLDQFCQVFRRCWQAFLKNVSVLAIMTSKRIKAVSKKEHFKKRRTILKAIKEYSI